jgi:hypothetical protein
MQRVSSRKGIPLSQAGLAVLFLAGVAPTMTRAQGVVPSTPSASVPDPAPRPAVAPAMGNGSGEPEPASSAASGSRSWSDVMGNDPVESVPAVPAMPGPPADVQDVPPARVVMGPLEVMRESIFGEASVDEWQPLSLSTFFSEGWDRPWAKSPAGTNGAPKQNWLGAVDAVFMRVNTLNFFDTNNMITNPGLLLTPLTRAPLKPKTNGNEYWASYDLYLPLNQRLELLVVAPFVASNTMSPTGNYVGEFGDLTFSERFRLIEQRNFSMQAVLTERTPTGQSVNGNGIALIAPSLEFWWNFAPRWVVRGGTEIGIGRTAATTVYVNNVAIGRYLTTKDARAFKVLVAHVAVSTRSDFLGRNSITDVYIAPGIRFSLDRDRKCYVLAAIQIPVSGPQPYAWQPSFALLRNY